MSKINNYINAWQFEQALAILKREQQANMPTPREKIYFQFYRFFVILFTIVCIPKFILDIAKHHDYNKFLDIHWFNPIMVDHFLFWMFVSLAIIIIIFFLLNLKFVHKLYQQARLRRKLKLNKILKGRFNQQFHRARTRNLFIIALIFILTPIIAYNIFLLLTIYSRSINSKDPLAYLLFCIHLSAPPMFILTLISFFFIWRGKERLEIVNRIHHSLSNQISIFEQNPSNDSINIAPSDYDKIARLERRQIIIDRQLSIKRARKNVNSESYSIQKSHNVVDAVAKLDQDTRFLVEDQLYGLTSNPRPSNVKIDLETKFLRLRVSMTKLDFIYQVDDDSSRVRIYSLENMSPNSLKQHTED
jgi:hypothetical protein